MGIKLYCSDNPVSLLRQLSSFGAGDQCTEYGIRNTHANDEGIQGRRKPSVWRGWHGIPQINNRILDGIASEHFGSGVFSSVLRYQKRVDTKIQGLHALVQFGEPRSTKQSGIVLNAISENAPWWETVYHAPDAKPAKLPR